MLSPLAPPAIRNPNFTASSEPEKPKPSPYEPPSDLTPGILNVRTYPLLVKGDVTISREIAWDPWGPENPKLVSNRLVVETGNDADHIHVRNWPGEKLQFIINGKSYVIDAKEKQGPEQSLWIKTKGGNDTVIVDDDVKLPLDVDGGDGDDHIQAGGGRSRIYGQGGNDLIRLGSGTGYAEGNDGDDTIINGIGNAVIYGNKGNDRLYAGFGAATKHTYLDGGDGKDELYAGKGHNVLHGGNDDDHLVGHAHTTFYTGKGNDHIWNNLRKDRIYAGANDRFDRTQGSAFTEVKPSNAGEKSFTVAGQEGKDFQQRVADDLEFLRSSPAGQQALATLDELALLNAGKITIKPSANGNHGYVFGSTALDNLPSEDQDEEDNPMHGTITDGVPGARADRGSIFYDRHAVLETADRTHTIVPITGLFHEIAHAYNGATGTFLAGKTDEHTESGESESVPNEEFQAIGLPSTAQPFDLDNNPLTPPSTINPPPFTENGLNEEMGKPLRKTKHMDLSDQGIGQ